MKLKEGEWTLEDSLRGFWEGSLGEVQGHNGLVAAVVQGLDGFAVGGASGAQLGGVKFSLL